MTPNGTEKKETTALGRLVYLSIARIPTGRAHGLQIMYMCQEFARAGAQVELVIPGKRNFLGTDPFEYYKVSRVFNVRRIPIPDLGSRSDAFPKLFLLIDICSFLLALLFSGAVRRGDTVYCRDYPLLFLCSPKRNRVAIEVHDIPRHQFLFRAAIGRASTVVAITHGVKDALVKIGISPERIVVAPDAVHLEDFEHPESREAARVRLGLPLDKKIVLYIGRIDDWKGTDTFFEAAKLLPTETLAVVIGGELGQVEKLSHRHPRVMFLGTRPYHELADNQSAADVLVLPNSGRFAISARYTSPLKLFSYMTSGRPIVASDLPSIREVIDESSAYLVPADDAPALARGITGALEDAHAQERSTRARDLVKQYTWEGRARHILATINRV